MSDSYRLLQIDPYLQPFERDIRLRMENYRSMRSRIAPESLSEFANGHLYFGFHTDGRDWYYREWAPNAEQLFLIGDFNDWDPVSHPLTRLDNGVWEICLKGKNALRHKQRIKVRIIADGHSSDRIPAYITKIIRNDDLSFSGQIWHPEKPFEWTDSDFIDSRIHSAPLIYETHVGMAQEKEGIGTYIEFADNILPRIKADGYNTVQIMGIMEHPYYASFGYQVTNFFAPSQWFGSPDELKYLINRAHSMGLKVLLDLVHSHSSKNFDEGLNMFDGTELYFKGDHPAWGSKLFDYANVEVLHFLLSNIKYWLEEYHFDGFRFDGVTSMLYHDHGLGAAFDNYYKYFSMNTNTDAVCYLQLANALAREIRPNVITIAEDMSGMPGMCIPIKDGGIGFDYRLSMGVPDFWIKTLKETPDDQWDMFRLWHEMTTRRPMEKNIGYSESHDQALVGDKTLIFWLADKEMYYSMEKKTHNLTIDRAIALHKMIRLVTASLAGEGYLNFMGNEFGHPEWIDFPREGNGWSYKYARRQWSLVDYDLLKYQWLGDFDKAMISLLNENNTLELSAESLWIDDVGKILAYKKGKLIFVFNFHPTNTQQGFFVPTHGSGSYRAILSTDEGRFGGFDNISKEYVYRAVSSDDRGLGFSVYLPPRTAVVLKSV
ncbi:MAG: alpha amylase C-terminal domain-containing protein [Clostridia bacterium]|nr:alpha amylase C-terminal domain-containing protein [Clostridia bacterium]